MDRQVEPVGARQHDDVRLHASLMLELARQFQQADIRWTDRHLIGTPLHPGFWVRRRLNAAIASETERAHGLLLDVGCGLKPYEPLFRRFIRRYVGLEYSPEAGYRGNTADVCGDAANIPFASKSVDTVLCTEVLEHVPDPDAVMREIARVLKPGGVAICTAPFFYPVHGTYDFYRYSPGTIATLMRRHGLTVELERPLSGTGVTLAILFNLYWMEIGFLWTKWLYPIGLVFRPLLWALAAIVNGLGRICELLLPSSHMSFNHLTIAKRPA
jgi:SAM-dependent methyltransferase